MTTAGAGLAMAQSAAAKATVDAAKTRWYGRRAQADGYLGVVAGWRRGPAHTPWPRSTLGRAAAYKDIAAKTGVTPEAAGQATAKQLYARLAPGQFWKPLDGGWIKK